MTTLLAYIPVIHRGHRSLCQRLKPDALYVLGRSFVAEIQSLQRDIRALDPQEIVTAALALGLAPEVRILERENISSLMNSGKLVCADDEAIRYVVDTYLTGAPITFEKAFFRWDKMAAVTAQPVDPDAVISESEFDRKIMNRARRQAERSSDWWRQVGGVIVKDGEVILEGFNQHQPTEHAPYINGDPRTNFNAGERIEVSTAMHGEAGLIARAAQRGISLESASLYATTFPCPNCSLLIIQSGITTVYYADGYSNLHGQENLKLAGVKIVRVVGV